MSTSSGDSPVSFYAHGETLPRGTIRDHTIRRHVCPEVDCGKSFKSPYHLRCHLSSHKDERPFPCGVCGKAFKTKSVLNVHERSHTKIRPYTCSKCCKSFSCPAAYSLHKLKHTGVVYRCTFGCKMPRNTLGPDGFLRRSICVKHLRLFHELQHSFGRHIVKVKATEDGKEVVMPDDGDDRAVSCVTTTAAAPEQDDFQDTYPARSQPPRLPCSELRVVYKCRFGCTITKFGKPRVGHARRKDCNKHLRNFHNIHEQYEKYIEVVTTADDDGEDLRREDSSGSGIENHTPPQATTHSPHASPSPPSTPLQTPVEDDPLAYRFSPIWDTLAVLPPPQLTPATWYTRDVAPNLPLTLSNASPRSWPTEQTSSAFERAVSPLANRSAPSPLPHRNAPSSHWHSHVLDGMHDVTNLPGISSLVNNHCRTLLPALTL